nr:MAG TPA: hypothetical protein [Bacteriophage sp.]DAQ35139.1 MAG TPA: hypothetical protein [Bacteriophage sp.]DAX71217.1 MAG TPA: hypothetical protein [Bacteriophage sp.]
MINDSFVISQKIKKSENQTINDFQTALNPNAF